MEMVQLWDEDTQRKKVSCECTTCRVSVSSVGCQNTAQQMSDDVPLALLGKE